MKTFLAACLVFALGLSDPTAPVQAQDAPVPVLFDTDMGPDADDAGTLALLHALVTKGEADLLAVLCSTTSPWCAPCVDAINTYYRRPGIPVATLKGPGYSGSSEEWFGASFNAYIAGRFPNRLQHGTNAPDAVGVYRQQLARQPDSSVVVVVTGALTNLQNLLLSEADTLSPLGGRDLVARKVRRLVVMGGRYPEGGESNFMVDPAATRQVVAAWPTFIMFSGFELGEDLLTGARLFTETPKDNPVRVAYHLWDLHFARRFEPGFDPARGIWPHSSFDQTAALYAARGLRDYWEAREGRNVIREDGSNAWDEKAGGPHAYLVERMPREALAKIIDDLMVLPPARD